MRGIETGEHYPLKLSSLPVSWAAAAVGDVMESINPGFPSGRHNQEGIGVPHLRPMNIDREGRIDLSVLKYVPPNDGVRLRKGDVLFNNTNSAELIGKTAAIERDEDWAFSNHMTRLRPEEGISFKFIASQLHYLWMTGYFLHRCTHHVNQASISSGVLAETVPLVLAPTREQELIVAEIEKQFTRLDAAVTALKRVQANLKRYRAAVLKAACEGRLVPTEAELAREEGRSYETGEQLLARILKERRAKWEADQLAKMHASGKPPKNDDWKKKYKEPEPPDTNALPKLPGGWISVNLDQIICTGPQNGLYKAAAAYGTGTPILRIDDYQVDSCKPREDLKSLQTSEDESTLYSLAPGDIVLNRVNSPSHLGKCTVVGAALCPCVFESNMMRFRTSDLIDPEWVTTALQTVDGKARLTANAKWAVNQASINQQDVKQTAVPLPPVAEQIRILAAIRQQLSVNSKLGEELDTTSRHAERLRQSILKRAFEGKLVAQDPDDEPASVLLERIRAERVINCPKKLRLPRKAAGQKSRSYANLT